jgi:hypothetical protein
MAAVGFSRRARKRLGKDRFSAPVVQRNGITLGNSGLFQTIHGLSRKHQNIGGLPISVRPAMVV